jgi:hypothetical protein
MEGTDDPEANPTETIEEKVETPDEPIQPDVDMEGKVSVKIDGEEKVVSVKDLVAEYQKGEAANSRFYKVSEAEKSVKEREDVVGRRETEFDAKARVPVVPEVASADRKEKVVALREAIYDGDEDSLDAAIESVLVPTTAAPVAPVIDVSSVASETMARIELREAVKKYEGEYPDLAKNTRLRSWVDDETEVILRDNPGMSAWDVIDKAAKSVQDQVKGILDTGNFGEKLDSAERKAAKKKASSTDVPLAPSAKASIGEDPAPPPTRSDIIKGMKEDRGQTT